MTRTQQGNIVHPADTVATTVGAISFINTLPIYAAFHEHSELSESLGISLVYDVPSGLNKQVDDGKLLISPVSSAYYLRNQDKLTLLDNLSVSSFGAVESVIFCSKKPLDATLFDLPAIAVPDDSETSVALLSCLISEHTNKPVNEIDFKNWFNVYPAKDYNEALEKHDAALIIGDNALNVYQSDIRNDYFVYDLSSLWVERYKTPFVFAVWVAQNDWTKNNPEKLTEINTQLVNNYETFLADSSLIDEGVTLAQEYCSLSRDVIHRYFTQCLNYNLTNEHKQTLEKFNTLLSTLDTATPQSEKAKTLAGGSF